MIELKWERWELNP